jgi:hypothetical protein
LAQFFGDLGQSFNLPVQAAKIMTPEKTPDDARLVKTA